MTKTNFLQATAAVLSCAILAACGGSSTSSTRSSPPANGASNSDPALTTDIATLNAGLVCGELSHPATEVVLLVHGTFTHGEEQYNWSYKPLLEERGYDVCIVTYPDRGLNDLQTSVEYIVNAVRQIHADTGRKIDMIGHSQGGLHPRWAVTWWPSLRPMVDDIVSLAAPHHGTQMSPSVLTGALPLPLPAAVFQMAQDSAFITALNSGDETPGNIDYSNIYTMMDELVQPYEPEPTAALDFGMSNPRVSNTLIQDVCTGRIVDHITIGLSDRFTFELTLDALSNTGPANVERAGGAELCGLLPLPDQAISATLLEDFASVFGSEPAQGFPDAQLVTEEPPLRSYATKPIPR
ncbi:esterase/lipase family protein [Zhongshania sp.]|jgi:pimeloyl-ACP methyl ester carboxylesterase|uniref:esterase/lipase family protein n=1 Tax=Zhongshania sp. TaxID=1971902 RepID=UPI002A80E297|nr:alpha/beta fold hydrolase [Zhongshania sp.]